MPTTPLTCPVTGRQCNTQTQQLSGVGKVEKCIQTTKEQLNDNLPLLTTPTTTNITPTDKKTIKKLKQLQNKLTIKPAEGIVLLDTEDYNCYTMCSLIQTRTHLLPAFPKTKSRENLCKQSPASSLNSKDTVRNFIHSLHQIQAIPKFHNFTEYRKSIKNLTTSATDCRTKLLSTETNSPVHRPPASTTSPIISRLPPKFHRTVNNT